MAVERNFLVKLLADPKQVISAFNKVQAEGNATFGKGGLGGKLASLLPSFKTISIAATAAFGAVTAAAGFAIKAAAEDEASQQRLATSLKNTFGASEQLRIETEKFIEKMTTAAAVADDKLRPAFGTLITATGDFTRSQKLLQVALDISAGTGRDLESVTIALAKASQGSVTALTRLGVPLDQNAVKAKDFDKIVRTLGDTFEGQAEAKANSAAGQFAKFGIAVDELKEQFGAILLPIVVQFTQFLTDRLIPAVRLAIDQFQSSGVRAGLAVFVAAFGEAGKAILAQIGGIGQGIFSFLAGVVNALKPLFVAIDLVRAFLAFGKPVVSIEKAIADASLGMANAFANFTADVDRASQRLDIMSKGPMDFAERRLAAVTAQAKGTRLSLEELGEEANKTGGKVKGLADKSKVVEDRLKTYGKAAKDAKSASEAFGRSQERVAKAQLSVDDAQVALVKAQKELNDAQQGGDPAKIEAAGRKVAAAERGLARSKFGVEEAVIAVRDAEQKLKEIRADKESTVDEIRLAEIALAEAQFRVADAQDNVIQETLDLNEARRNLRIATDGLRQGDEELVPFQDAVAEAQKRSKEAVADLTEAIKEQAEALDEYKEALEALAKVSANFPRVAATNPISGLIDVPAVPSPPAATGFAPVPQTVRADITVNSSVVNPAQVGQEILDYLKDYERVFGPIQFGSTFL
jgi:hypothetical protein